MIYMIVGVPGSGKTWALDQLGDKFDVLRHDDFIINKHPDAYVSAIINLSKISKKSIVIEAPFSMSETIEPLERAGLKVTPIFIIEDTDTLEQRYYSREGRRLPKGHLTRQETYYNRARNGRHFYGTSEEVLKHLKELP